METGSSHSGIGRGGMTRLKMMRVGATRMKKSAAAPRGLGAMGGLAPPMMKSKAARVSSGSSNSSRGSSGRDMLRMAPKMKSKAKASKCSMMAKSSMQKADDIEMADESAMPTLQKRTSEPVGYAAVVSC